MALKIRTVSGNTFRRCGIAFGKEPTVVDDETLAKKFDTPAVTRKSRAVREILKAEPMLVCEDVGRATKSDKE